jgi:hypothetical protein
LAIRPTSVTIAGGGAAVVIPVDLRATEFNVAVQVTPAGTGVGVVQMTASDILSPGVTPTWITITALSSVVSATPVMTNITVPCTAIRVSNTDAVSPVVFNVVQAG